MSKATNKLSVRQKEAAEMLSISERTLRRLTAAGAIPFFRLDHAVMYSVEELRAWMARRIQAQKENN